MRVYPIRVLHMIASLEIGGSQTMVMNLYRAICREKVQFDFIIDHVNATMFKEEIEKLGGKVYTLPTFKGKNFTEVKNAWDEFFTCHPEYKVLHSHSRSYASIYLPIARKHGVITIAHSHSTSNGKGIQAFIKDIMQLPIRYQADYLFACSEEAGIWLYGKRATKTNRYKVVPNAIDIKQYKNNVEKRLEYREELGIQGKRVFLHVGRLHESKNHFFLLNIFRKWIEEEPNSVLLLAGDGDLRIDIEKKIRDLVLDNAVIMLGARIDIPQLLNTADCFLFPSKWEGLPVTVVEAQASGIPCLISSNITNDVCISELVHKLPIDKGEGCWIEAMKKIKYDRGDVSESIRNAGFDIKQSATWLTEFYDTLVESKS